MVVAQGGNVLRQDARTGSRGRRMVKTAPPSSALYEGIRCERRKPGFEKCGIIRVLRLIGVRCVG